MSLSARASGRGAECIISPIRGGKQGGHNATRDFVEMNSEEKKRVREIRLTSTGAEGVASARDRK